MILGFSRNGALLLLLLAVFITQLGCVRRRLTIRTNPPGALVYVDDQEIGVTPVSTSFTYYGTRKITVIRDGYETVTEKATFNPPWYEIPPIDFIAENLWPHELRDEREVQFDLTPQQIVPSQELIERAENLRSSAQQGYVAPLPGQ